MGNTSGSIRGLLQSGRGQLLEFMPIPSITGLAETMVAFANADGGTIFIGLGVDGRVSSDASEDLDALLLRAQALCRPPIVTEWQQLEAAGGMVVALTVPRAPHLHSMVDGRVLFRSGSTNRPLGGEETQRLSVSKGAGSFEEKIVEGAGREDFDEGIISEYTGVRKEKKPRVSQWTTDELLQDAGAIDGSGAITVAGLLLFGKAPERYLPQAGLVFVRFAGTESRRKEGLPGYQRREEIFGPLARVIERTWDIIWEEMSHEAVIPGLTREETHEYPPFAVREALVNAICHRDYGLRGRRIEVRMFDERLVVISPGGLPGHITLDNIVEEHFSRNPRIVRGLYHWGYIEELGLGVDRMIEDMMRAGHPHPHFESRPFLFSVTLSNARERMSAQWAGILNGRQLRALNYVQENGSITNREFRELCSEVGAETLRLDLAEMVSEGILLRIGAKRGTRYILK